MRKYGLIILGIVLVAAPLLAQNPTGTITGQCTYEGGPLPGVTVTATSTAMQGGTKTAITDENGAYTFRFLPPGDYNVVFSLESFQTLKNPVKISVAQTRTVDAVMYPKEMTEEITVTAAYETISSGMQSSVTYDSDIMENLPVARDLEAAVRLTPGVHGTGPSDNITIAGSQSHENLFLINGVVVNENLRGQAFDLFIEDAIEETTTAVSGVSAEYGRFAGGVVNTITKSGGNEFSGSYRLNLDNEDWEGDTPLTQNKADEINKVHEGTFGGYILKDRLWFFLAGRDYSETAIRQMAAPRLEEYTYEGSEKRYEAKLTFSPHLSHRLVGSYIEIDETQGQRGFLTPVTALHIDPQRELPQDLKALNYTGVITDNFFVEAQYSERNMAFVNSGGEAKDDPYLGTVLYVVGVGGDNAPYFCGAACGDEERNNENYLAKGSLFLSSANMGTHDIVFGYDNFKDIRLANNYQSASNFVIYTYNEGTYDDAGNFYPIINGGNADFGDPEELDHWPVLLASTGTDFQTTSLYANDTWRLNNNLTFSIGARYDINDGVDGGGVTVADDSRLSPRLGLTWDIMGDGEWLVHASYARYVTSIANSVAGGAGAGTPSWFGYSYLGDPINQVMDAEGNITVTQDQTSREVVASIFDWFFANGGVSNLDLLYSNPNIRGVNTIIDNLKSPYADEFSVGLTKTLGSKGLVRADYVHREFGSFYSTKRDLENGTIVWSGTPFPGVNITQEFDLAYTVNDNSVMRREYDGLHTQFQYRLSDTVSIGGNWTWSHARGNFDGETSGSGPVTATWQSYPEYKREEWAYPTGDLSIDQRHKIQAWAVWDVFSTAQHSLSVSWLENYFTGSPYGDNQPRVYVYGAYDYWFEDPGYISPPSYVDYRFFNRDAFRTDDVHHTDISVNYSFFWNIGGVDLEFFIQPEILNLFNESAVIDVNNTVYVDFLSFDPYTETPVLGEDYELHDSFGQPENAGDYQDPRTFRLSLGVRF